MNNVRRTAVGTALAVTTLVVLASCAGAGFAWKPSPATAALLAGPRPAYPAARFAVTLPRGFCSQDGSRQQDPDDPACPSLEPHNAMFQA